MPAIAINATAGGHAFIKVTQNDPREFLSQFGQSLRAGELGDLLAAKIDAAIASPHDRLLSEQIDRLRDAARGRPPELNLPLFESVLESLPATAGGVIRFRLKANIGLQHLQKGDPGESARWLLEAHKEAPSDPRAIANKALALWLMGEAPAAYRFGREQIADDPTNEHLAGYLPQFAAAVPEVTDPLDGIIASLRSTESVIIARIQFLRVRDIRPDWWDTVRDGAARFPNSNALKVLSAVADVDQIARDDKFQRRQILSDKQRATLQRAVEILDPDWESKKWLLSNPYDDALNIFTAALIAHHFLHDTKRTIELIEHLAVSGVTTPGALVDAANMAHSLGHNDLAKKIIACAPEDPALAFQAATIAIEDGDWDKAVDLYAKAAVPETEQVVTQTVLKLAPLVQAKKRGDPDPEAAAKLRQIHGEVNTSPRSLVLVASVARRLGHNRIAQRAFKAAVDAVSDDSHIATRLMVAAYATRVNSAAGVIRLLDGHLPAEGFEREYERLAAAHANEHPHRRRNIAFFTGLPPAIRERRAISRAHASVLLNVGRTTEAMPLLQRLHAEDPSDAFVTLRLLDGLHRKGDQSAIVAVAQNLDLAASKGEPGHIMQLAAFLVREKHSERAYAAAYDLVRKNRNDPDVAMAYIGLGLMFTDAAFPADPATVQVGASVTLKGPGDARRIYVIDEGEDFFSLQVIPPGNPLAIQLMGKGKGDAMQLTKPGIANSAGWVIETVTSKYAQLHKQIIENFETRFPGHQGFSTFSVEEGDVSSVFEIVRIRAERNEKIARSYIEKDLPLEYVARLLGGDVSSFAAYVRSLGADVVTCEGGVEERSAAIEEVLKSRGGGAVLDPYTVVVASELGVLADLKAWFGNLFTPSSTLDRIDRAAEQLKAGLGRDELSVSWHNGQFYRHEVDDTQRSRDIEKLLKLVSDISTHVNVQGVLVPDDVPVTVSKALAMAGSRFFDAGFLAQEHGAVLLSDDLRYRQYCASLLGIRGVWLQVSLQTSQEAGLLSLDAYADAVVGLAARCHGHVALNADVLHSIARRDDTSFTRLRTAISRLGGAKAHIPSHLTVFREFMRAIWHDSDVSALAKQASTSFALDALVTGRANEALDVLRSALWQIPKTPASRAHIRLWLRGHWLALDGTEHLPIRFPALTQEPSARPGFRPKRRQRRRRRRAVRV